MIRFAVIVSCVILLSLSPELLKAQAADSLIAGFKQIHQTLKANNCSSPQLISNRAMNIFLSDKMGSYLASYKDLSFYKNNITFNAADGTFSLNHNFFRAKGFDKPVNSFLVVGVKTNAANAFAAAFSNKPFANELGVTIKQSWIHTPTTLLNNCVEKKVADASREQGLALLIPEMKKREEDYLKSLASLEKIRVNRCGFTLDVWSGIH